MYDLYDLYDLYDKFVCLLQKYNYAYILQFDNV